VDDPRRVLARHGLRAKKSWGQNFLHDRSVHARIVAAAACTPDDIVVEIGAGLGTLTAALAAAEPPPARVIALERDADMLRVLAAELGGDARVAITPADAAAFDFVEASRAVGRPSSSSATCRIRSRARSSSGSSRRAARSRAPSSWSSASSPSASSRHPAAAPTGGCP
jgi:16S rRNA (adenine1518-N6/adenine1519-N6)-dimethyltransferase